MQALDTKHARGRYVLWTDATDAPCVQVLIKRRMAIMQHAMTKQTSQEVDASCRILKGHLHATGLASWVCSASLLCYVHACQN